MPVIGILALQGSIEEHLDLFGKIKGVSARKIKYAAELKEIDALVIPGGESTTMGKLLRDFGLLEPAADRIKNGMPVWGTCAGMILLAKNIVGEQTVHLGAMDISARRNAYGSQLDSFKTTALIPAVSEKEIPLVFIRAPWVESVGENVRVLACINGKIAAARQDNMLATAFHPELTEDASFHKYFVDMVRKKM